MWGRGVRTAHCVRGTHAPIIGWYHASKQGRERAPGGQNDLRLDLELRGHFGKHRTVYVLHPLNNSINGKYLGETLNL